MRVTHISTERFPLTISSPDHHTPWAVAWPMTVANVPANDGTGSHNPNGDCTSPN